MDLHEVHGLHGLFLVHGPWTNPKKVLGKKTGLVRTDLVCGTLSLSSLPVLSLLSALCALCSVQHSTAPWQERTESEYVWQWVVSQICDSKSLLCLKNRSFAAREESIVIEDLLITWRKPDHTCSEGAEFGRTQRKRRASRARRGKSFCNAGHCTAGCDLGADHNINVAPSRGSNHLANSKTRVWSFSSFFFSGCCSPSMSSAWWNRWMLSAAAWGEGSDLAFFSGGSAWWAHASSPGARASARSWCNSSICSWTSPLRGTKTGSRQSLWKNWRTYCTNRFLALFHCSSVRIVWRRTRHLHWKEIMMTRAQDVNS